LTGFGTNWRGTPPYAWTYVEDEGGFMKRLLVFFPLAFLLSWYGWLLQIAHVTKEGGINPLGPVAAAFIVAGVFDRWAGIKRLLARIFRWRMGWGILAFVLLVPISINGISLIINLMMGAPVPSRAQFAAWPELLPSFAFIFLFIGMGEEPGWRGYALPWLQKKFSPVMASLLLGVIWAAWHIPLFGVEFTGATIPAFLVSIIPASVILAWMFNRSGESALAAALFHATVNTVGGRYVFRMFEGADQLRLWWIYAMLWLVLGVVIATASKGRLGFSETKAAAARARDGELAELPLAR